MHTTRDLRNCVHSATVWSVPFVSRDAQTAQIQLWRRGGGSAAGELSWDRKANASATVRRRVVEAWAAITNVRRCPVDADRARMRRERSSRRACSRSRARWHSAMVPKRAGRSWVEVAGFTSCGGAGGCPITSGMSALNRESNVVSASVAVRIACQTGHSTVGSRR